MSIRLLVGITLLGLHALADAQGTIYESQGKGGVTLSNEPSPGGKPVDKAVGPGPVYESKDKAGPVFSGQPTPGAKPLDLGPPNVIQVGPGAPSATPAPSAVAYQSLAVVRPANGATIHANNGEFTVRLRIMPSLQASRGDRVTVKLDGNALARTYSSSSFRMTAAEWQASANPADVQHALQVAIVNRDGVVVIESAPVRFYVHRAFRREGH